MEEYEEYIQELCKQYNKSREDVEKLAIVKEVKEYYINKPVIYKGQ